MSAFGQRLKAARRELGVTQATVANAFDVSQSTVKRWENEDAAPLAYALWLASRAETSLDKMLGLPTGTRPREVYLVIDGEAWAATAFPGTEAVAGLQAGLRQAREALEADGREEQPRGTREANP